MPRRRPEAPGHDVQRHPCGQQRGRMCVAERVKGDPRQRSGRTLLALGLLLRVALAALDRSRECAGDRVGAR